MQIGWVGGLNRSETYLTSMATAAGHKLEFHNGDVRGNGFKGLRRLVHRSSFVIILITINSHQGVQLAKRMARKNNCPAIVMQRCSPFTFRELLAAFDGKNGAADLKSSAYKETVQM
jgi:DNA-binding LytR/AlgR family response regulator